MRDASDIIITVNGPGEIVSRLLPVIASIKQLQLHNRIIVVLVPCRFASGNEYEYVTKIPEVGVVIKPAQILGLLLSKMLPNGASLASCGVVVFLGGDLFWAWLLKKRLGYSGIAYTEGQTAFKGAFNHFYMRGHGEDLMVDAFEGLKSVHNSKEIWSITFFPGSRPRHFSWLVPFYIEVARLLKKKGYECNLGLSPFISENDMKIVRNHYDLSVFSIVKNTSDKIFIMTDFLITIPGTNTAEAAIAGVPMLVIMPLNRPEEIPLEGLLGAMRSFPVIGKIISRMVVRIISKKRSYYALPNIKAGRKVIPEMVGVLSPIDVAENVIRLLSDKNSLDKSVSMAREAMGKGGAARKIAMAIKELVK